MFRFSCTDKNGNSYYIEEDYFHREDGPAVVYSNGKSMWYKYGKLDRDDGPAIIDPGITKEWYKNGKRHREDGPAIEYISGKKEYFSLSGPIIEKIDCEWFLDGKCYGKNNEFDLVSWKKFIKTMAFY